MSILWIWNDLDPYVSICAMDVSYPDDVWMPCLMGNRRHGESFDRRAMLCYAVLWFGVRLT